MQTIHSQKVFHAFLLSVLMVSAFFIQLNNFKKSTFRTIDEDVYYFLGYQLMTGGLVNYNTIPYANDLISHGRPLPKYFTEPLFKYPPLFASFITISLRIFGDKATSAIYVPLLFGALLIFLTYLLGSFVFNPRVGLLSALFVWMDPVTIICSQKVWMETTLAFFVVLAVYVFLLALKNQNDNLFIISGLVSGLATATKYPGFLATAVIFIYGLTYRRELLKNKKFILSLFMPLVVLLPWFYLNYKVYGFNFLSEHLFLHFSVGWFKQHLAKKILALSAAMGVGFVIFLFIKKWNRRIKTAANFSFARDGHVGGLSRLMPWLGFLFALLVGENLIHALQFTFLPETSWYGGAFASQPPVFYFGRLIEFSLIYVFAFSSFFVNYGQGEDKGAVIRLTSLIILLFFVVWGNYQSRYILPAIPFLLILASAVLFDLLDKIKGNPSFFQRLLFRLALIIALNFIVAKALYINFFLSYPNNQCYF